MRINLEESSVYKRVLVPVIVVMWAMYGSSAAESQWRKVKEVDGIAVYTRPAEGSDLDEFMGQTLIDAPVEALNEILEDVPALTKWMFNCKTSYVIERAGKNKAIVYNETKAPWPVENRDVVVESNTRREGKRVIRAFRAVSHPRVPPKKGVVRITDMNGEWVFERRDEKTFVTYRVRSHPGGSIPPSIANWTSIKLPVDTLQGLRRMAGDQKYRKKN